MCARDDRVAATVAELGAVPYAVNIVSDEFARHELRLRAAGFTAMMSANVELHKFFPDGNTRLVEEGFTCLTRSEHWALADEGCRGIARVAFRPAEPTTWGDPVLVHTLNVESQGRLDAAGAPAAVLRHLRRIHQRALTDISMRPSCVAALTALLNLSSHKECQVSICKAGLMLLLRIHLSLIHI